jgi:hypothetical protein
MEENKAWSEFRFKKDITSRYGGWVQAMAHDGSWVSIAYKQTIQSANRFVLKTIARKDSGLYTSLPIVKSID